VRAAPFFLTVLAAAGARAAENDLQLWRLGHPDPIVICTKCDGTDNATEPGDPGAQYRFARLTANLGLAFVPAFQDQAQTTGQAGFEIGFSSAVVFPKMAPAEWPTEGSQGTDAPDVLFLPTVTVRKGLGASLELGAAVSILAGSQILGLSGQLRWAPVDGLASAPDIALRLWGTHLVGTQELDLTEGGADILVSKSFGVAATMKLQPYAQYGLVLINAKSTMIDFHPFTENQRNPVADDGLFHNIAFWQNRYHRIAAGLRFLAGSVMLGIEGSVALGTNPVEQDGSTDQFTRVWAASGRLGLAF
jgi:hypothetical protein